MSEAALLQADVLEQYLEERPFIRRRWLADAVDKHLDDTACRHVLITAEAGMGKSSLMAWLTTRHRVSPRYFIRLDSLTPFGSGDAAHLLIALGRQLAQLCPEAMADRPLRIDVTQSADRVGAGGRSVGVQAKRLIANPFRPTEITVTQTAGELGGEQVGVSADEIVEDVWRLSPTTLQRLALLDPAESLAKLDPDARIVLLIDGLDELRHQPPSPGWTIADWLVNCPALPANVTVVVASRPDPVLLAGYRLRQRGRLREVSISAASKSVAGDLRDYADQVADNRPLRRTLEKRGHSLRDSARAAASRADGNFLFLVSWSRALSHAAAAHRWADVDTLADHDQLPATLTDLYDLFMVMLQQAAAERWARVHRRMLGVVVVARAPLTMAQWAVMAGQPLDVAERASHDMLQLLTISAERVKIFHLTLAEYLTAEETRAHSPHSWIDAAMSNQETAAQLIAAYGDDWSACQDDYALANIVGHLTSALEGGADDRQWCVDNLTAILGDAGFLRRKIEVVGATRTVADYATADAAMGGSVAARLLAEHAIRLADGDLDADTVHSALGYRAGFDPFYAEVLGFLSDLDFVTERAPGGDDDLEPASIWADFAEIAASRFRRTNDLASATRLLDQIAEVRGDQSRALYERGYLEYLHGRVDAAIDYLDESAEAAQQAGRTVSGWISALVRDQVRFHAGRIDVASYDANLVTALEVFTTAAAEGNPHAERWIMNAHDHRFTLACLTGDVLLATQEREALRDNEWVARERPELAIEWQARLDLARGEFAAARADFERILPADALTAEPSAVELTARRLYEYGAALEGAGDRRKARQAWEQVLRCSDQSGSWSWKARTRDRMS
ncbi:hypothetical protein [Actinokineospora sp. HUAS TT18]|uniref:hypothetical protein n=1 Tax=Actinokineospora sp. HUAS TT18 TaxID=3447451 RepID=UPI003F526EF6